MLCDKAVVRDFVYLWSLVCLFDLCCDEKLFENVIKLNDDLFFLVYLIFKG